MDAEKALSARIPRGERLRSRWDRLRDGGDLGETLEALYRAADLRSIAPDPLQNVLRYPDPEDQEVSGFLTAAWAWGRAEQIVRHTRDALDRMGPHPAAFARRAAGGGEDLACFRDTGHRLHAGGDWASLVLFAGDLIRRKGSIAAVFADWFREEGGIRRALVRLRDTYRRGGTREMAARADLALGDADHLLADAGGGSACKRLNLWLRWMVRSDHVDPGPWRSLVRGGPDPSHLLIPLDVHVARLGRCLGMTNRSTPGWSMAEEITSFLARFDSGDPVRYDFALCRLGILEVCPTRRDPGICTRCPIYPWCRQ